MKSLQAFTEEIDFLDDAAEELSSQIDRNQLLKNTCAFIFCGHEVNVDELTENLKNKFDFPFFGCTGIGMLSSNGFSQETITMLVLTADDCEFELGMTDEINTPDDLYKIKDKYNEISSKLSEKEKIIFAYSPWWENVSNDNVVKILDEISGGVPVFGGIASDGWTFDNTRVFLNDTVSTNRVALMMISGNVRSVFTIEHSTTGLTNSHKVVTKSEGPTVYTLNNEPATEYLEEMGIISEKTNVLTDYLANPFISTITKTEDNDEIDVIRALVTIDHENKSCSFIGNVEEGSELNMVLISRKDIEGSVKKAFDDIFDMIEKTQDYKFSTILCSSCGARYSLIVSDKNTEGKAYADRLPEGVNVQGFYTYGEFCPAKGKKSGKLYNVISNESLCIVAF
ncbi:MAG: FIST C-terminal domain-containing protein [Oscillospiraceae bacterium]|nr:FIST C-terminal domain-containing protein [Oscillospiraceae bacterium]